MKFLVKEILRRSPLKILSVDNHRKESCFLVRTNISLMSWWIKKILLSFFQM